MPLRLHGLKVKHLLQIAAAFLSLRLVGADRVTSSVGFAARWFAVHQMRVLRFLERQMLQWC